MIGRREGRRRRGKGEGGGGGRGREEGEEEERNHLQLLVDSMEGRKGELIRHKGKD